MTGKRLGLGGYGVVLQAEDLWHAGELVAVKRMGFSGLSQEEIAIAQCLWRREALILAGLHHLDIPRLVDSFFEGRVGYLIMSYIEGKPLVEVIRARALTLGEILAIGTAIGTVLHYLHSQPRPVLHCDLKLENILMRPDGSIALVDFGTARFHQPGQHTLPSVPVSGQRPSRYNTFYFGTVGYAPREQYPGQRPTSPRSDLYSLGAVLHHLLSGRHPSDFPRFHLPRLTGNIPPALVNLVWRMVQESTRSWPRSATSVRRVLQEIAAGLTAEELAAVPAPPRKFRLAWNGQGLGVPPVGVAPVALPV